MIVRCASGISTAELLTDDGQHAAGLGRPGVTLVLGLIIKHRLVDDENPLSSFSADLVLLAFPDLTAVLEPANLQQNITVSETPESSTHVI